jgi:hypothetical protein
MARFYQLLGSAAPWGDYGYILRNGLLAPRREKVGPDVELERTGPFIPPITFPFAAIVVTEATRQQLETGCFKGLQFTRARYVKVVQLDWQEWDMLALEPQLYPASGEPENYIIKRKNCDRTAALMPAIWAFNVPSTPGLQLMGSNRFRLDHAPNADIFREHSIHWVSERMRVWLERNIGEWVSCVPVKPD